MTVNYARRQQRRRLMKAASRAAGAAIALVAAALATAAEEEEIGLLLALLSGALAVASRHSLRLAARSRVGAESEAQVRRALAPLASEGWRVAHAVDWPGRGDLDHVLRSPSGMGFVIETKTLRYTRAHLARTVDSGRWLARRRWRYPAGVCPVICVTRARRTEQLEEEKVLVVSLDRLMPALAGHAPPSAVDATIARARDGSATAELDPDDCIEERTINRPLAVVSGPALAVG
jgi:hypothetical protein